MGWDADRRIEDLDRPWNRAHPTIVQEKEREDAAAFLIRSCGTGALTLDEFSDRVDQVWVAESPHSLRQALEGLPAIPADEVLEDAETTIVSVLGTQKRTGYWRLPQALRVTAFLGTCKLDLSQCVLDEETLRRGVIDIDARAVLGTIKVVVPDGVHIAMTGHSLFGSREVRVGATSRRRRSVPVVRLAGRAVLGTIKIRSARAHRLPRLW